MKNRKGQALVEYTLLLILVSVISIVTLQYLGEQTKIMYTNIDAAYASNQCSGDSHKTCHQNQNGGGHRK